MSSEVVQSDNSVMNTIDRFNSGQSNVYSSFKGNDFETRKKVAQAVSNSQPLADHVGKKIKLANVIIQSVEMANEQTGELETVPRVVLVDSDGNPFHAISKGIMRALENLYGIVGQPSEWEAPIDVEVRQDKGRNGYKFLTLSIV